MANEIDLCGSFVVSCKDRTKVEKYLKSYPFDKEYPLPNIVRFPAFEHRRMGVVAYALIGMIVDIGEPPSVFYDAFIQMISGLECDVVGGEIYLSSPTPYVNKITFNYDNFSKKWEFNAEEIKTREVKTGYFPKVIAKLE